MEASRPPSGRPPSAIKSINAADVEIGKLLGAGMQGQVYLAKLRGSKKRVVVKQICLMGLSMSEKDKIRQEAELMKTAHNHPNVVRLLGMYEDSKTLNLVLEACRGGSLHMLLNSKPTPGTCPEPIPEQTVMHWLVQLILALYHLHGVHILHRDIKPANIFISKNHNIIKLGDFGIAKQLDHSRDLAETVVGTPCYMPPEVLNGAPYTYAADIWSLGCIAYEMAVRERAFNAKTLPALIMQILNGRYTPVPSRYSRPFAALVDSMLRAAPEERPTALALLSVPLVRQHTEDLLAKHSLVYPPMASPSAQPRPPSTPALKPRQLSARPPERKLRAKSVRKSAGNPVQGLEEASRRQWRAKASKSTKKRSDKRDRIQGQGTVSTKYMKSLPPQKWEGARRFEVRQQEMAEKRYAARQLELRDSRRKVRDKDVKVQRARSALSEAQKAQVKVKKERQRRALEAAFLDPVLGDGEVCDTAAAFLARPKIALDRSLTPAGEAHSEPWMHELLGQGDEEYATMYMASNDVPGSSARADRLASSWSCSTTADKAHQLLLDASESLLGTDADALGQRFSLLEQFWQVDLMHRRVSTAPVRGAGALRVRVGSPRRRAASASASPLQALPSPEWDASSPFNPPCPLWLVGAQVDEVVQSLVDYAAAAPHEEDGGSGLRVGGDASLPPASSRLEKSVCFGENPKDSDEFARAASLQGGPARVFGGGDSQQGEAAARIDQVLDDSLSADRDSGWDGEESGPAPAQPGCVDSDDADQEVCSNASETRRLREEWSHSCTKEAEVAYRDMDNNEMTGTWLVFKGSDAQVSEGRLSPTNHHTSPGGRPGTSPHSAEETGSPGRRAEFAAVGLKGVRSIRKAREEDADDADAHVGEALARSLVRSRSSIDGRARGSLQRCRTLPSNLRATPDSDDLEALLRNIWGRRPRAERAGFDGEVDGADGRDACQEAIRLMYKAWEADQHLQDMVHSDGAVGDGEAQNHPGSDVESKANICALKEVEDDEDEGDADDTEAELQMVEALQRELKRYGHGSSEEDSSETSEGDDTSTSDESCFVSSGAASLSDDVDSSEEGEGLVVAVDTDEDLESMMTRTQTESGLGHRSLEPSDHRHGDAQPATSGSEIEEQLDENAEDLQCIEHDEAEELSESNSDIPEHLEYSPEAHLNSDGEAAHEQDVDSVSNEAVNMATSNCTADEWSLQRESSTVPCI